MLDVSWNLKNIETLEKIISWTNENSGFLSLILFVATIAYGWWSGLWSSLNKKPKLSIRFIDKVSFYSFYYTGDKWLNKELNTEFKLHKTGFVSYMSIANIGNKPTSIDKIYLGYEKNKSKSFWEKTEIEWIAQCHPAENFSIINKSNSTRIIVNNLRVKFNEIGSNSDSELDIGKSSVGVAYFEQVSAWGNLNPKTTEDDSIRVIIKITDIYKKKYKFKTKLKKLPIEKAREFNPHFGNVEKLFD